MKGQPIALSSAVADRIIALLEQGATDLDGWRRAMRGLERETGLEVYTVLLFVLTHLEFSGEKAREHWERILRQWEQLNETVPGRVDLRVAVLQYFLRSQRKLRNPAIVELKILKRTQDSVIIDELTRLHNFRHFQDRLKAEARRADREGTTLSLLMADVDDFKAYNDDRGHLAGNVALRRVAAALKRAVRETDLVARYGGEEFAVLLPNTPKVAALRVGEKVRRAVEKARVGVDAASGKRPLTVSVGLASLPGDAADLTQLVERADQALYVAKSVGKNCVRPFSDERREFTRLDAALVGRFNVLEQEGYALTTLNVSEGGLLFLCEQRLAEGALVRVELRLPSSPEPVECVVRAVRVVRGREGFEIGSQIVHMPRAHQRRFRVFLHDLREGRVALPAGHIGLAASLRAERTSPERAGAPV
jgi:diguanylate cyclase (GGDEF)-like protein